MMPGQCANWTFFHLYYVQWKWWPGMNEKRVAHAAFGFKIKIDMSSCLFGEWKNGGDRGQYDGGGGCRIALVGSYVFNIRFTCSLHSNQNACSCFFFLSFSQLGNEFKFFAFKLCMKAFEIGFYDGNDEARRIQDVEKGKADWIDAARNELKLKLKQVTWQ